MNRKRDRSLWLCGLFILGQVQVEAQGTLPDASLAAYVALLEARIPGAGTEAFVEPSAGERAAFASCLQVMLAGDAPGAAACMALLNYDVSFLNDVGYGRTYLVAEERSSGFRGLGTYIVDPAFARNIVIAVPHPLYDVNTPGESQQIFQEIGARALFMAGTHRCADSAPSPCTGTTSACGGGAYRISDAAHFDRNFMQAAHEAVLELTPPPRAFNVHGQSSEPVDVVLSDGTTASAPSSADVNRLRDSLLARGVSAGSCNWQGDAGLNLCGTSNTQGSLYNGSTDPCGTPAAAASGLFLHLEQKRAIRDDPSLLIEALKEVFSLDGATQVPPPPAGLTATAGKRRILLGWQASSGAESYNVKRGKEAGGPYSVIAQGVSSTTYTDAGLTKGVTYHYVVTAVSSSGESASSDPASAAAN